MKDFLQELLKQKSSMLIVSGIFLLLLGMTSGLQTENFSVAVEPAYRIVSILFGALLILIGIILAWKDSSKPKPVGNIKKEDKYLGRSDEMEKTNANTPSALIEDQDSLDSGVPDRKSPSGPNNDERLPERSSLIPDDILNIFRGEFVKPKECHEVSKYLYNLAKNISLGQQNLSLQFALKRSILILAPQVEAFRKKCEPVTKDSNRERIEILDRLEKIARYSPF